MGLQPSTWRLTLRHPVTMDCADSALLVGRPRDVVGVLATQNGQIGDP